MTHLEAAGAHRPPRGQYNAPMRTACGLSYMAFRVFDGDRPQYIQCRRCHRTRQFRRLQRRRLMLKLNRPPHWAGHAPSYVELSEAIQEAARAMGDRALNGGRHLPRGPANHLRRLARQLKGLP